jgi:uncharacterized protein
MRILVTGATGFIGRAAVARLAADGHEIRALSRGAGAPFVWRPGAGPVPAEAFDGVDAVLHLAGETLSGRWTAAKMRAVRESRVAGTRSLVDGIAALTQRPRVLVSAGATGYYGDRGEEPLDEDSPPGDGFLAEVCRGWEAEAARAETLGLRVVRLRFGIVLGRGGGALGPMLPLFRIGLGGPLGSGRQWWPWIAHEDAVGLIAHALATDLAGPVNAVGPEAVRQRDFARALGRALRRPALVPTPAWALRIALGPFARELLSSRRVAPRAALGGGYRFRRPGVAEALEAAGCGPWIRGGQAG